MTEPDLRAQGEAFLKQARGADYLTEVALDRHALDTLLAALRAGGAWARFDAAVEFALAVAAVNFAYYQEQDEGFREPFLHALTGRCDINDWQNRVGPRIRRAIEDAGHALPDLGFRYVGPVRMHAGLSFARLPAYAKLVADLRDDPGWPAVRSAPRRLLAAAVQRHFTTSAAAEEFLGRPQGVDFIRATCDVLTMYRQGYLTRAELDAQPGFRTGFLTRLVELLDEIGAGGTVAGRGAPFAPPRLLLDPESLHLFLRFDPGQVARRAVTCDQLSGRVYRPRMPIGPSLPPADVFSGTFKHGGAAGHPGDTPWEAHGWLPQGRDWATFDERGMFVAAGREGSPVEVDAGIYMVACDPRLGLDRNPAASALGPLGVGGLRLGCDYDVYHLDLRQSPAGAEVLPGLRVARRERAAPRLAPVGGQTWSHLSDLDVVWSDTRGGRPAVDIQGWSADAASRFRLILKVGESESLVPIPAPDPTPSGGGDVRPVRVTLEHLPARAQGRIWLQPIGRSAGRPLMAELAFARFPDCTVDAPRGLYEESSRPPVVFDVPAASVEVGCDADQAAGVTDGARHRLTYRSVAGCNGHRAELRAGPVRIDLWVPVHRARLRERCRPHVPLVLDGQSLEAMHQAHLADADAATMEVAARPGSRTTLSLHTTDGVDVDLASKDLGPAGTASLAANEILDALNGCGDRIGQFCLTDGSGGSAGRGVGTGSWFVGERADVASLRPDELAAMPARVADPVRLIHATMHGVQYDCDLTTAAPSRLAREAANWHAAAVVLDGLPPMAWLPRVVDPQAQSALDGVHVLMQRLASLDAESDPAGRAKELGDAYDQLDPLGVLRRLGLALPRWEALLVGARLKARERADAAGRVGAFGSAIRAGATPPEGVTALMEQAALDYLRAETEPSPAAAQAFLRGASRRLFDLQQEAAVKPFWRTVGDGLLPLSFLRQCRVAHALRLLESYPLGAVCAGAFCALAGILRGTLLDAAAAGPVAGGADISPRRDDAMIFAALRDPSRWGEASRVCWLGAWLGWRRSVLAGADPAVQNTLREAALCRREQIPSSVERAGIMRELHAGVPARWLAAGEMPA